MSTLPEKSVFTSRTCFSISARRPWASSSTSGLPAAPMRIARRGFLGCGFFVLAFIRGDEPGIGGWGVGDRESGIGGLSLSVFNFDRLDLLRFADRRGGCFF